MEFQRAEDHGLRPLASLNAYMSSSDWKVVIRVTGKREPVPFGANKESKVFEFYAADEYKGQMKCVAFNEMCERYYPRIEKGKCYTIEKANIRLVKDKRYNPFDGITEYEMHLTEITELIPIDDVSTIPAYIWNFIESIEHLNGLKKNAKVDVVGVITNLGAIKPKYVKAKQGHVNTRTFTISDDKASCAVTLWGDKSIAKLKPEIIQNINDNELVIIGLKSASISDYQGVSLTSPHNIIANPTDSKVIKLKKRMSETKNTSLKKMTTDRNVIDLEQISIQWKNVREMNLEPGALKYVQIYGTIIAVNKNTMAYYANNDKGSSGYRKKCTMEEGMNSFWCEFSNSQVSDVIARCCVRLIIRDNNQDLENVAIFSPHAEELLSIKADDVINNQEKVNEIATMLETRMGLFRISVSCRQSNYMGKNSNVLTYALVDMDIGQIKK